MALGQIPTTTQKINFIVASKSLSDSRPYSDAVAIHVPVSMAPGMYRMYINPGANVSTVNRINNTVPVDIYWVSGGTNEWLDLVDYSGATVSDFTFYTSTSVSNLFLTFRPCYEPTPISGISSWGKNMYTLDGKLWNLSSYTIYSSTNGTTWSTGSIALDYGPATGFVFGSGETNKYIAYYQGQAVSGYHTSTDGITWTSRLYPNNLVANQIIHANGVYYMVTQSDSSNGKIWSSTDGVTWTQRYATGTNVAIKSVVYGAGETRPFVAVGDNSGPSNIITSTDGITWTTTGPLQANYNYVHYDSSTYYAFSNGSTLITSTDGLTWSTSGNPISSNVIGVSKLDGTNYAFNVSGFVRIGTTITDYNSWTHGYLETDGSRGHAGLGYINQVGNKYFGVNDSSALVASTDIYGYNSLQNTTPIVIERLPGSVSVVS